MKKIILSILVFLFYVGIAQAEETIEGTAKIKDGDSIVINGKEIRLHGLDAPEWNQPCEYENLKNFYPGREATAWLRELTKEKMVLCDVITKDKYNRFIATCYIGDMNINKKLVSEGLAFADRFFTQIYVEYEKEAKADKKGFWVGKCQKPRDWREANQ